MRKLKWILITIIIIVTISSVLLVGFYFVRRYVFDVEKPYYATVIDAKWSVVYLDSDKYVTLAGVLVPDSLKEGPNPIPELVNNIGKILKGKKVKVELLERHRSGAANKHDLVRIYLEDGTCVNTYLLKNGMAFFSKGYYRGREKEIEAEKDGQINKRGIWAKDLKLLYVGSLHWEAIHYPECPEVKKINPEDRIEYYTRPVKVHWYRDGSASPEICSYCAEIRKTKPKELQ